MLCCGQVSGTQVVRGGPAHEAKSKTMYSRIFSWAANVVVHSLGNVMPFVLPLPPAICET